MRMPDAQMPKFQRSLRSFREFGVGLLLDHGGWIDEIWSRRYGRHKRLRLSGQGVSSDIWRVSLPDRAGTVHLVCIKRALAKLKVEADWQVPVERNAYEVCVAWFKVGGLAGRSSAKSLGHQI